jgi:toxin ParE1/3/4
MRLTWGPRARRDLHDLVAYIAGESPQRADLVAQRILTTAQLLSQMPGIGRPGRVQGTRERVVGRTPYILAYKVASARVRILRVYHGARRWPSRFDAS